MSRGLEDSFPLKLCKIIRVELVLEGQSASQLCRFKWALRCPYQGFLLNAVATVTCMVGSLVWEPGLVDLFLGAKCREVDG